MRVNIDRNVTINGKFNAAGPWAVVKWCLSEMLPREWRMYIHCVFG